MTRTPSLCRHYGGASPSSGLLPRNPGRRALFCLGAKLRQGPLSSLIICFHNISSSPLCYVFSMPRAFKNQLPPLEPEHRQIGSRIASVRKKRGLTQKQLADAIGISQYLVSDYETGRVHLSDEMLIRFVKALRSSADVILGLKDDKKTENEPSLRLQKRLAEIERLPAADQRALLRNIDMFLRAAKSSAVESVDAVSD